MINKIAQVLAVNSAQSSYEFKKGGFHHIKAECLMAKVIALETPGLALSGLFKKVPDFGFHEDTIKVFAPGDSVFFRSKQKKIKKIFSKSVYRIILRNKNGQEVVLDKVLDNCEFRVIRTGVNLKREVRDRRVVALRAGDCIINLPEHPTKISVHDVSQSLRYYLVLDSGDVVSVADLDHDFDVNNLVHVDFKQVAA